MNQHQILVRKLGQLDYREALNAMKAFTRTRQNYDRDEFWILEHDPVYTQGYSCKQEPFAPSDIPIVATDRGGQMTYHGPGQLIVYLLLDLKRRNQGVRHLMTAIESAIIALLRHYGIEGRTRPKAPGVYVGGKKIASMGIRVSRGSTYHGLSLNVDMDISPFQAIDVCGYQGLEVTTMHQLGVNCNYDMIQTQCAEKLAQELGYLQVSYLNGF